MFEPRFGKTRLANLICGETPRFDNITICDYLAVTEYVLTDPCSDESQQILTIILPMYHEKRRSGFLTFSVV